MVLKGKAHVVKENTEALVATTKEIGLEVNVDKTKYMVMSRDQNAGRNHNIRIDNNSSFKRLEEFKYLGKTLMNQNSIQEEVKSRLKSGNACYLSVQNLLYSKLLSKEQDIQNHNFACCFCMGVKLGLSHEGRNLR
jgi:predicted transcriptional regulator